jgi:hypothetical protein
MYEAENGPKRLITALHNMENRYIEPLAYFLHYEPKQLQQDIEAKYNHFYNQENE